MPETDQQDTSPAVTHRTPWLGIFEVRRELEPHNNVADGFEVGVDHELARAAEAGSFDQLQRALRSWLAAALVAQNPGGLSGLDIDGRGRYVEELLSSWHEQRPPTRWRAPSAGPAEQAEDRVQWAVRITGKSGIVLSPPSGTREAAEEHLARIHAGRTEAKSGGTAELVWRRTHPWGTGEPAPCAGG